MPVSPITAEPVKPDTLRKRKQREGARIAAAIGANGVWVHRIVAAIPIICTNAVAVLFQARFAHDVLSHNIVVIVLFSCTIESIAISVAYHQHLARISHLRSGHLKAASILIAVIVAILNASHEWHANLALAVVAALCSLLSPFLWGMYSAQVASPELVRSGYLEPAALKLGSDRWLYHPLKSFAVKRYAAWAGERNISIAITGWEHHVAETATDKAALRSRETLNRELGA